MIQINNPKLGEFSGIYVESTDIDAATAFVHSLIQNHQIELPCNKVGDGPAVPDASTHVIKTDEQGRRCLVRKRFSLI